MADQIDKVYEFRSLESYTFKQRVIIRVVGWVLYVIVKLICRTLRYEVQGVDWLDIKDRSWKVPIVCGWHDRLFPGIHHLRDRGLVVMSSISFDAEYTARCIQRFGYGVIKGSSTRGGTRAMVEMIRLMKRGIPMTFAIDGPRGPRHEVKPGPPLLAKRTGNPIVPMCSELGSYWTLNSWDKFRIPKPFTRTVIIFGDPIFVDEEANDEELERKRTELQEALDALVAQGEVWKKALN